MLLAVDIGNSYTKFGLYDGERLTSRFSLPTPELNNDHRLARALCHLENGVQTTHAIICSVVPGLNEALSRFLVNNFAVDAVVVDNHVDFGLTVNYEPLESLGTDRLVNAFSACQKSQPPIVVCSFGTATTIDVVDGDHRLLGGIIAPGVKTAALSLVSKTSLLPDITLETPDQLIGTSTEKAIRSGVVHGHVAMVEGLIAKIRTETELDFRIVSTGGYAKLVSENSTQLTLVDEHLTLDGLRMLFGKVAKR